MFVFCLTTVFFWYAVSVVCLLCVFVFKGKRLFACFVLVFLTYDFGFSTKSESVYLFILL